MTSTLGGSCHQESCLAADQFCWALKAIATASAASAAAGSFQAQYRCVRRPYTSPGCRPNRPYPYAKSRLSSTVDRWPPALRQRALNRSALACIGSCQELSLHHGKQDAGCNIRTTGILPTSQMQMQSFSIVHEPPPDRAFNQLMNGRRRLKREKLLCGADRGPCEFDTDLTGRGGGELDCCPSC